MTKAIRIENADNSQHKVKVTVMAKTPDGQPDAVVEVIDLSCPTQLITKTIWKDQYLVITEADE